MKKKYMAVIFFLCFAASALAKEYPGLAPASLGSPQSEWFRDARFGMFVHWGIYSVPGRGEWVMFRERIPVDEYEKLADQFNPTEFDAAEWVSMAKKAGARYICFTSKHHDGFCMFDSRLTDYNSVRTRAGRDFVRELAEECHRQGIKLFLYYSLLDWHHPDCRARGWEDYIKYYQGQVRELCENYGEIGGFWFDGWWAKPHLNWHLEETYKMIHELQPQALIVNNAHAVPFPGEDYLTVEQSIGNFGVMMQTFSPDRPAVRSRNYWSLKKGCEEAMKVYPLENCNTMYESNSWGYDTRSVDKSIDALLELLVVNAGQGRNLLLNTGPMPDGRIPPEHVKRYLAIGEWLDENGESIYGTRRMDLELPGRIYATGRGNKVYLHMLDWPGANLSIAGINQRIKSAGFLNRESIEFSQDGTRLELELPPKAPEKVDTIIVLSAE
jgi:alpha-L-fucosidase